MRYTEACGSAGKSVRHSSGRTGKLTSFSGLVRVFVRYDDGIPDEWGTLPEELEFVRN